jgi:predicted transcriptional regulator
MLESNVKDQWLDIDVEELFCSRLRIKILKILAYYGEINISALVKETASNHAEILKSIAYLTQKDLIEEKFFGRIHIIRLRKETLLGKVITDFFNFFLQSSSGGFLKFRERVKHAR